mgnify:CR=1 FL=1
MKHIKMMILTDYKGSVRSDGAIHELIIIRIRLYQVKTKVHVKPYRIFPGDYRLDNIAGDIPTHLLR